jgi:hypothetical protein
MTAAWGRCPKNPEEADTEDELQSAWELEQEARAVNAADWEPLPGMVKKRCLRCHYFFAVTIAEAEVTATCPDCAPSQSRKRSTIRGSDQPKRSTDPPH